MIENERQNKEFSQTNDEISKTNEELFQAKEKLQRTQYSIDNVTDGIFWIDKSAKLIYANRAAYEGLEYSIDELLNLTVFDIDPEFPREKWDEHWQKIIEKGSFVIEAIHYTKSGRTFPVEVKVNKVVYNDIIYNCAIARDITDRKQAEAEIIKAKEKAEESEQRLKLASITGQFGIWDWNVKENILEWDDRMFELYGIAKESFSKDIITWINCIHPDDKQRIIDEYNSALNGEKNFNTNFRIIQSNGTVLYIKADCIVIRNSQDDAIRMIGINSDITESKESEHALLLRESYLRAIIENQPGLVWLKDVEGRFLSVNNAFLQACGQENLFGKNDLDIWPEELAKKYMTDDTAIIAVKKPKIIEEPIFEKGEVKWFETFKAPIFDDEGTVIGTTGYSRDITERKKNEEELIATKEKAQESDRLKTAFLQNMSHEIRTPMNAIMGFSGLLKDNLDNRCKLEYFSKIIGQRCNDLLEIINDLLDIAKIESGQLPINLETLDVELLFNEMATFLFDYQAQTNKKHINLDFKPINKISGKNIIITDKIKLKQILTNLITNALKYTEKGNIEVGYKYNNNQTVQFYVSDTGIGIPSDKHALIFDRFTQLNQNKQKNISGIGLGLTIVKGLISLLGGEINLQSEQGKGSTFFFSIPYNIPTSFNINNPIVETYKHLPFSGKTILIVDDDHYNAIYLREVLSNKELNILLAETGEKAIEIALSQPVDLVLMDVRLPDINGYEATKQIRYSKPKLKIIAQTAYASSEEQENALEAGCNDYISKPIKSATLFNMLEKYLIKTNSL